MNDNEFEDAVFGDQPETDMLSYTEDTSSMERESGEDQIDQLYAYVWQRYSDSKDRRLTEETRWLTAYRNYRGIYGPEVQFSKHEKSKVFVKLTKVKVLAAYGQLTEVMFGSHKFPLSVEPSHLPEGVAESAHISLNPQISQIPQVLDATAQKPQPKGFRFKASGEPVPVEVVNEGLEGRFGYLKDLIEPLQDQIKEGPGGPQDTVTFSPALVAAKKMEKRMLDQLEESQADKHLRHVAFEMALFGTGIMKGPFVVDKEYPRWVINEATGRTEYKPIVKTVPMFEAVGIWDFYPDPDASSQEDAEYVLQRHKLSRTQLRELKSRPFFRDNQIEGLIEDGPNYNQEYWENTLEDYPNQINIDRWEVLEFWGFCDTQLLKDYGVKVPRQFKKQAQVSVNIWASNGRIIRVVLNPYKPARIPFYAVPYELNPYSLFGVGVAENMADSQMLVNGFMRMAVDNQALSGNVVFEVDATNLAPGQDLEVFPGKVFVRESGAPGQAIFATQFPNVSDQNLKLFQSARELADEATGLPSYSHGQTGVSNPGRTASGISMLMNAANGSIRTVVKNLDDYLLRPLGKSLFAFNMQFDPDPEIKGDLEVRAKGTESLMANEVRSQRLMQFLGVVSNPLLAPFAKLDKIVREIAKSLDLDPDKIVNNLEDAAVQAMLLQKLAPQPPQGAPAEGSEQPSQAQPKPPAGADAKDSTGRGGASLGTGTVPTPGEKEFSARKDLTGG